MHLGKYIDVHMTKISCFKLRSQPHTRNMTQTTEQDSRETKQYWQALIGGGHSPSIQVTCVAKAALSVKMELPFGMHRVATRPFPLFVISQIRRLGRLMPLWGEQVYAF